MAKFVVFQKMPKKNIRFPMEKEKIATSQTPSSTLHMDEWTRYLRHKDTIKLSKNKMDSKVIKSHQYSLEKSHDVLIELNSKL